MKKFDRDLGRKMWAFAAGCIPIESNGVEPEFTSHDKIAILNTSDSVATIKLSIFYSDAEPVTYREINVGAQRLRKIRFNDLIDPLPIQLDRAFGFVLTSDVNVVVQFSRADTSSATHAGFCVQPYFNS